MFVNRIQWENVNFFSRIFHIYGIDLYGKIDYTTIERWKKERNPMHMENNNKNRPDGPKKNKVNIIICVMAALLALTIILFLNAQIEKSTKKEISYSKFIEMLKEGNVSEVTFDSNVIYIKPKTKESVFEVTYYTGYVEDTALVQDMLNKYNVDFSAKIDDTSSGILSFFAVSTVLLLQFL